MSDTTHSMGIGEVLPEGAVRPLKHGWLAFVFALMWAAILTALLLPRDCTVSDPIPAAASVPITDARFIAPPEYRAWIMQYAAEFHVPLDVAIRLPFEESGTRNLPPSLNPNGTYDDGVFQLNSRYHRIQTTQSNIREGLREWARCWRATGAIRAATLAYVCGLTGMKTPSAAAKREAARVAGGTL